jgi:hypothetical protein
MTSLGRAASIVLVAALASGVAVSVADAQTLDAVGVGVDYSALGLTP